MKTNFLLFLTTTTFILISFVILSNKNSFTKSVGSYKTYINKEGVNKNAIDQEIDEQGCYKTPGFTWCKSLNACLRAWEECPQIAPKENQIYTISECEREGGRVIREASCSFAEEILGNIKDIDKSICCIPIRGRI
jgi:hypothetical protein